MVLLVDHEQGDDRSESKECREAGMSEYEDPPKRRAAPAGAFSLLFGAGHLLPGS